MYESLGTFSCDGHSDIVMAQITTTVINLQTFSTVAGVFMRSTPQ